MFSLDDFATSKLQDMEEKSLRRRLVVTTREADAIAFRPQNGEKGEALLSFCCNDYLNLSQNKQVKQAAHEAIDTYGVGAGASRLITGNHPLLEELERRLAKLKGTQAAIVFGSGYLTNLGVIPSLMGPQDLILLDELDHACIHAGAALSKAHIEIFRHNDVEHAGTILSEKRGDYRHALIAVDGVYSMDGDLAPLPYLSKLAQEHDAWLMSDDAHGIGVVGGGRGSAFAWGNKKIDIPLQMGTLSKAVGSYGGYLCASQTVVDFLKTRARTFIYSTGLAPASAAAALAALDVIETQPDYCAKPLQKARDFAHLLGLPQPQSTIVPLIIGEARATLEASQILQEHGFLVTGIRPPTVPEGTARLRFTFTAEHKDKDIARLAHIVRTKIIEKGT